MLRVALAYKAQRELDAAARQIPSGLVPASVPAIMVQLQAHLDRGELLAYAHRARLLAIGLQLVTLRALARRSPRAEPAGVRSTPPCAVRVPVLPRHRRHRRCGRPTSRSSQSSDDGPGGEPGPIRDSAASASPPRGKHP
jgi:hypothetical protein